LFTYCTYDYYDNKFKSLAKTVICDFLSEQLKKLV
jgi:hypothetical protein